EFHHVLSEAHQHLGGRLGADAAIHVWLARKRLVQAPEIGDRVAEEDDAVLGGGRRWQCRIRRAIPCALAVVVRVHGDTRGAVAIKPWEPRGRNRRRRLW